MGTFIAMLRGVNVSGQKPIRMPELKALVESLGFANVTTYVQSGNVVLDSADLDGAGVAAALEAGIAGRFGFAVTVIVRDTAALRRVRDGNPFLRQRGEETDRLYVTFLAAEPAAAIVAGLAPLSDTADEFAVHGREVYLHCPGGYGQTKLSNNFFEKKLKVAATTRNWRTVNALLDMAEAR